MPVTINIKKRNKSKMKNKTARPSRPKKREAEMTRLGSALRVLGGLGGRAAGSLVGFGGAGQSLGSDLGATLSRWLGSGDYTVTSNSLVQKMSAGGTIPSMHADGQTIVVRHKEFLTEVTSSTSFSVQQQFPINPGQGTTFPWLQGLASQYSEYRIRGMIYHYVPTSGEYTSSGSAALGSVMLQTSYRASEVAPTSKVELLNEYWSSESKPSMAFCHPIECDPKENPFNVQYIRLGSVPPGDSILMYDLGKTTLAVSGNPVNGTTLGDLWVTYEIELRKPVLTNLNNTDIQTFRGTATQNINNTNSFGTNFSVGSSSFQNALTVTNNQITFPLGSTGSYLIECKYGTNVTSASFGATTVFGSGSSMLNSDSTTYTVGTGNAWNRVIISITQPSAVTTVNFLTAVLVNCTFMSLTITEINPN